MEDHEPIVTESALRHGVSDVDMLHALEFNVRHYVLDDGMTMFIGPSTSGLLLEIGVIEWYENVAIVHAMPARDQFLR
ncbi:hypothetical protein [Ruania alba]|uniref:Uncharacterized protein n=1 Tax=Ruania alba TaxID=648782 RepID=A0A1H5HG16_9MICO|nr:hypothetical protein [Ruania alba]SEE26840.1 hypothetical protein SAMN04488554_1947 [Ruania alba]